MTYKESYEKQETPQALMSAVERDLFCATVLLGSKDRCKVISDALNEVIKQKGWEQEFEQFLPKVKKTFTIADIEGESEI